jgi:hypothetical protein
MCRVLSRTVFDRDVEDGAYRDVFTAFRESGRHVGFRDSRWSAT